MTDPAPQRGRIGGVDYGTVRIGVAIGDLEVGMASPLEDYTRRIQRHRRNHKEKRMPFSVWIGVGVSIFVAIFIAVNANKIKGDD